MAQQGAERCHGKFVVSTLLLQSAKTSGQPAKLSALYLVRKLSM
jgi:hypothetical protein